MGGRLPGFGRSRRLLHKPAAGWRPPRRCKFGGQTPAWPRVCSGPAQRARPWATPPRPWRTGATAPRSARRCRADPGAWAGRGAGLLAGPLRGVDRWISAWRAAGRPGCAGASFSALPMGAAAFGGLCRSSSATRRHALPGACAGRLHPANPPGAGLGRCGRRSRPSFAPGRVRRVHARHGWASIV